MSSSEEEDSIEQAPTDLSNSDVVTKYKEAAKIVNMTLKGVCMKCKVGANTVNICEFGDMLIKKQCDRIFKKEKRMEKGVGFPTCISVNNVVCHCSPLQEDACVLQEGDIVKIDLAAHIDGFIATAAHTVVIGATEPVDGRAGDVLAAVACAQQVAQRLVVNGRKNAEVTAALKQVADDFGVSLVQGVLSHQMKRFVIDGNKVIIGRQEVDQKVDENTFETYEVYAMDIAFSSGDGKTRQSESRTTVFKRALDVHYRLKRKSSRYLLSNVQDLALPFTLRDVEDTKQAKAGIIECVSSELLTPFPVLVERPDVVVAQAKMTLLLMPSGTIKITGDGVPTVPFVTQKVPSEATQKILAMHCGKKKRKKKKKKNKKKAETTAPAEGGGADAK
jgi:curved DNA binding protein